jgi:hypothetical protein
MEIIKNIAFAATLIAIGTFISAVAHAAIQ